MFINELVDNPLKARHPISEAKTKATELIEFSIGFESSKRLVIRMKRYTVVSTSEIHRAIHFIRSDFVGQSIQRREGISIKIGVAIYSSRVIYDHSLFPFTLPLIDNMNLCTP